MDIKTVNTVKTCENGKWLTIKDGRGLPTDAKVKVIGVDSKGFKAQINLLVKLNESNKGKYADMEKSEADTVRVLVAITLDWENIEDDGEKIPFSKEFAEEFYTNSPLVSEQVIEFAKNRVNFLD